jgi:hypothetical protein
MGSPAYILGEHLASMVNALEEQHDKVLFWCMRFDDRMRNRLAARNGLLVELQQLRVNLAALLPAHRLAQLEEILAEPAIRADIDPFDLRSGYFSQRSYLVRQRSTDDPDEDVPFRIQFFGPDPKTDDPGTKEE